MIIGTGLDGALGLDFATLRELGEEATDLGFESIWTPSGGVPDGFELCAAWAHATASRPGGATPTGIAVVPAARAWTPLSLAIQAATLGVISNGRFTLGLGTGGAGAHFFENLGLPNRPVAVMRDYLEITRSLLRGEVVTYHGPALSIVDAQIGQGLPPVPVYLAALGPQMLRLAGAAADGVSLNWATPEQILRSRATMLEGATTAGRSPDELRVSMYIRVCIDEDADAARRALAANFLRYALARPGVDPTLAYRGLFGRMGFDDLLVALEARRANGATHDELADDVPEDLLRTVGCWGTPDGAPERFAALAVGLDEALVRVITTEPSADKVRLCLETLTPAKIRGS